MPAVKWKRVVISHESFESAGVWDVDGDGHLDIISGGFWYQGPDFKQRHFIAEVPRFGEYYDDFSSIGLDITGNGRQDYVTGGWFGKKLFYRACPDDPKNPWPEYEIASTGNIETTRAWDIDGDGEIEICPNTPGRPLTIYKCDAENPGK